MQQAGIPTKIPTIWGVSANPPYINTIPVPSQIGIQNGRASFTDGFPPNAFLQQSAGGAGPWGGDFNGILQLMTQWLQWYQAGAPVVYDPAFQSSIGGYPNMAIVQSAKTPGLLWLSTVDNNLTNPDTGGAGWQPQGQPFVVATGAANTYSGATLAMSQRLSNVVIRTTIPVTNTGASTFNAGYGALPINTLLGVGTPNGFLQAGSIVSLIDTGGQFACVAGGGMFVGNNSSWLDIDFRGWIRQGGQISDTVDTNGLITFSSQPHGMTFPNDIITWHVENLSSAANDAQQFMSAGITSVGTDTGHIKWFCTTSNGATPHTPADFRWEAAGF